MSNEYTPAITLLRGKLEAAERNVTALRSALDTLLEAAGMPPLPPRGGGDGVAATTITTIKNDTFFGKRQQTAIREFLEMRRAVDLGPATPREIYDALKQGGYQFEAKNDEIALVGLRALLRKRSQFFTKLPNGSYGLASWYEHAKKPRGTGVSIAQLDDDEADDDGAAALDDESDDAAVA